MSELRTVAVVGGSLAGLRAVEALRRRGYGGRIVWIGEEAKDPYDRPPLSKQVLEGVWDSERITFRREQGYEDLGVERLFGRRATSLNCHDRTLVLDDGTRVGWNGLVIATGASPRRLPGTAHIGGVYALRTLDDALAIRAAVQRGARAVVVGAGFIGLEVASSCRKLGAAVTVLEALDVPLKRAIGPDMGNAIAVMHRDEGVDLRTSVSVSRLEGHDRVEAVLLSDDTRIPADLVVVGIGVIPNVGWLEGSGVRCDDGVVCDERLATTVPNVVAAGDVARWPHPSFVETMRVEHWTNAVEQADAAVRRLLEGESADPFGSIPYFWSDQHGVKIQFAGRYAPGDATRIVEGSPAERKGVVLFGRGGKVTGVLAFNRPPALVKYRRAISEGLAFES
jgi:NADPH-dependent 2,4-dienoyl-CoA reductase/sulfur reductase-like enzyme